MGAKREEVGLGSRESEEGPWHPLPHLSFSLPPSYGVQGSSMYLFPLPAEYEKSLMRKLGMTHDMRQKFKQVCVEGGGDSHARLQ